MRAVLYDETGGPEVLRVADVAVPRAEADEVVVAVRAAGLNPYDRKVRSGLIPSGDFPRGLGTDFAGVVATVGEGAAYEDGAPVLVGDEVLGWSGRGLALRELLGVPAGTVARKPVGLGWDVAGALATSGLTACKTLEVLGVGSEDVVLLSAASGGVGLLYGQLARRRGATVIGTASPTNHDFLRGIGVIPVAYGPGLADRVRAAAPKPVTAVQDNIGGDTVDVALELGVPPARICTIVDYTAVEQRGIQTPGRYARSTATLEALAGLCADGELLLPVVARFPLDRVVDAYMEMERSHPPGKVVVEPA